LKRIGVIMNGVTGRMGLNQHLVRSILAIREQGGVLLPDGDALVPDPILVGRSESKLRDIAAAHGLTRVSTDLDACLANPADEIYFDATVTSLRVGHVRRAIAAGKHVYCEKPVAASTAEALELARLAGGRGVKHGVVQDKLFLPGIRKLKRLVDGGFFGRILSVRGEFGYWVFEGDGEPAQRPSWNYRKEDGGGIILDMFAHWRYLLDHTFGAVTAVQCTGAKHIAERVDEQRRRYAATADDAAYATFALDGPTGEIIAQFNSSWAVRVYRDDLLQIQVDGTLGSAIATLRSCKIQRRADTPRAVWNPDVPNLVDFHASWQDVPDEASFDNAFKVQWERFLLHVATDAPFPHDFGEGAKGVQLAELAVRSWGERRWVDVPALTPRPPLESSPPDPLSFQERGNAGDALSPPSPAGRGGQGVRTTGSQGVRTIRLPLPDGSVAPYTMHEPVSWPVPAGPIRCRVAYAAAHVVCDPLADRDPIAEAPLDWEATLAYRCYLWSLGLAVAEAMDTAQRGMGLGWPVARELIRRSLAEARAVDGVIACGAGTDQLVPSQGVTLDAVERAYEEQVGYVEGQGGGVILMASRALARAARGPDDYARVYGTILRQVSRPVILHWLGDMFDPELAGYWGSRGVDAAMNTCLGIIREHRAKIDGIKVSLLDAEREIAMRACLPDGVRMYTGDDFNYPRLILGEGDDVPRHSDALLGIFDAIAPAASAALQALDRGDVAVYRGALEPTVPLARHIFRAPTYAYKTGIVFLAYLNGHQRHFRMIGGAESWRSVPHLAELFRLADAAGLLLDPDCAADRMRRVLALAGVE
jgi:predicted dehydrogenase